MWRQPWRGRRVLVANIWLRPEHIWAPRCWCSNPYKLIAPWVLLLSFWESGWPGCFAGLVHEFLFPRPVQSLLYCYLIFGRLWCLSSPWTEMIVIRSCVVALRIQIAVNDMAFCVCIPTSLNWIIAHEHDALANCISRPTKWALHACSFSATQQANRMNTIHLEQQANQVNTMIRYNFVKCAPAPHNHGRTAGWLMSLAMCWSIRQPWRHPRHCNMVKMTTNR